METLKKRLGNLLAVKSIATIVLLSLIHIFQRNQIGYWRSWKMDR